MTQRQTRLFNADGDPVARVKRGVDTTIKALRAGGRLEPVDAALIAMARTLADAMDAEHQSPEGSRHTVAMIAGRLHPIVADLRGVGPADGLGDLLDQLGAMGDAARP